MKIPTDVIKQMREISGYLPIHHEKFGERKHIHNKDIITKNLQPKDGFLQRGFFLTQELVCEER